MWSWACLFYSEAPLCASMAMCTMYGSILLPFHHRPRLDVFLVGWPQPTNALEVQVVLGFTGQFSEVSFSSTRLDISCYHLHYQIRASGNVLARRTAKRPLLGGGSPNDWISIGLQRLSWQGLFSWHLIDHSPFTQKSYGFQTVLKSEDSDVYNVLHRKNQELLGQGLQEKYHNSTTL